MKTEEVRENEACGMATTTWNSFVMEALHLGKKY